MSSAARFYCGLFLITASTLMLQLIQSRILSVVSWYHLAFFVISVAMFGLTAGSVYIYLRGERFTQKTLSHDLGYFSAAFGLSAAVMLAVQMTLAPGTVQSFTTIVVWGELALCLSLPFFFSGVVVSLALTRSPFPIGRVYGVDLLGAAVGCLGVLIVLDNTDGPSAVLWAGVLASAGAALFAGSGIGGAPEEKPPFAAILSKPGWIAGVLAVVALANGTTSHGLQPMVVGNAIEARGESLLFEEWNSHSRIMAQVKHVDGVRLWGPSPKLPKDWDADFRRLNIDGRAGTIMYRFDGEAADVEFLKYDVTNLVHLLPDRPRAAVIGVGGGRDMLSAWVFGRRDITGVELNPIFVNLLTREDSFREYAGIADIEGMKFEVDEARSWFARSDQEFDIIQMSMIDTWAATGAGAYTLSENGLYTLEAWRNFIGRLSPDGVFTVSRWYAEGEVNETGRMVSLATRTLLDLGAEDPSRHLYLASTGKIATILVARRPFTTQDLASLAAATRRYGYDVLIEPGGAPASEVLRTIVSSAGADELQAFTSGLELDLTPPTDERPFFFNQLPLQRPLDVMRLATRQRGAGGVVAGNIEATATLLTILLVSIVLVLATLVIPLRSAIKDVGRVTATAGTAYFLLIGIGFMLTEIGLLQRMGVVLGHPIYSLSVVLFSLILATGIGSLISDRFPLDSRPRFVIWSLLVGLYILSLPQWLPGVLHGFQGATLLVRAGLCVAMIVPAGLLMGYGFPTGMALITAVDPRPTPWFWGINGAAGVLASILAVVLSMALGIDVTLALGGLCYLAIMFPVFAIGFEGEGEGEAEGP